MLTHCRSAQLRNQVLLQDTMRLSGAAYTVGGGRRAGPLFVCRGRCPHRPAGGHTGPPLQENASLSTPFSPGGTSNRGAAAPLIGRFKERGVQRGEGRFPLSGGNVERSETKGVGTIRNPPFPKRLFGDFLSAQKVTRPQAKHPLTVQNLIRRADETSAPTHLKKLDSVPE